ncbi:hypothetical protein [Lacticaseibacillus brantae]|uniref:Uncharacterized protein n=1 Tax=Lacticaseibacillus brantae DSM 23927 TaxID=1423727 RepID=A0A0R2BBK6_9LACO|nr:hypothetical protein [Lacticaseibacillus brantae]KRM73027.1 hypothetical protein FC34_GL000748 [Lacticaseibacillus brantae DSM 23927]
MIKLEHGGYINAGYISRMLHDSFLDCWVIDMLGLGDIIPITDADHDAIIKQMGVLNDDK